MNTVSKIRFQCLLIIVGTVLAFHGCGLVDSSSDEPFPPLPGLEAFYVKWLSADSVQFFYEAAPNPMHGGGRDISLIVGRLYRGDSPEGPWDLISTDTLSRYTRMDSARINYRSISPGMLQFYRLDLDYLSNDGETKTVIGSMLATIRPVLHPDEMEAGPDLVSEVLEDPSKRGGTAISQDGTKLFAKHREGRIFDLQTGKDITPKMQITKIVYISGAAKWVDSMLYCYGNSFTIFNSNTFDKIIGVAGNFAYPKDDTSFVVHSGVDDRLMHYNISSKSFHIVDPDYKDTHYLDNTTTPPNYSYISCLRTNYLILYPNLEILRAVTPFRKVEIVLYDGIYFKHIQWDNDADRLYFWASFSGSQEIWTYSIQKDEYKQITGYKPSGYPGLYTTGVPPFFAVTLNFVYDHTKDRLILFFKKDIFSYAVRYIPVSSI